MTDKELGIRAAELFTEKPWEHRFCDPKTAVIAISFNQPCCKCGLDIYISRNATPCTLPDPIDVNDWNVAMRLAKKIADTSYTLFVNALEEVLEVDGINISDIIAATPQDLIEAACKAKGGE